MTIAKKSSMTAIDTTNFESQINIPQMHPDNTETTGNNSTTKFILNYIESKITQMRCTNFKFGKFRKCVKLARRSLGLQKSPKKKGYGKLITDEEKRFVNCI